MAKKLMIVWLSLLMVLFSSISIYAEEDVQGDFFEKHVIINGTEIVNYNLQYPFLMHNNATYFPLSPEMAQILGLTSEMDWESRTLKLLKTEPSRKNISSNWLKNNNENVPLDVLSEVKVLAYVPSEEEETKTGDAVDVIDTPQLSVKELDLTGTPVLAAGKYLFLPVRALAREDGFGWDIYFDPYYGVCISTIEGVSAKSFYNKAEAQRNKGLALYIKSQNSGISTTVAQQYVFLFQRAEAVYGVEAELLMAVASKESHFGASATARGGARGMMQIMPATATRYGLTINDLYDAKTNIDFGAMYISERISAYSGNWVKGLSAYNQGSVKVNRGTHSTAYAERVLSEYSKIGNYLKANGFAGQ